MAKAQTRAELQDRIKYLERENREITGMRDMAIKEAVAAEERAEDMKVRIFDILKPNNAGRIVVSGAEMGFVGRDTCKRTVTLDQIARRAGRLVTIEEEYDELKDRTLPIPKMVALENERNDRRGDSMSSGRRYGI